MSGRLNPKHAVAHPEVANAQRKDDRSLDYLNFLWSDYACDRWWFEVCDIYRRVLFIGVMPLLGSGTFRASIGCLLSILAAVFCRETSPFLRQSTNIILVAGQYQILATCLGALTILSGALESFSLGSIALGTILLTLNFLVIVFCAVWCVARFLKERQQERWRGDPLSDADFEILDAVMLGGAIESHLRDDAEVGIELPTEKSMEETNKQTDLLAKNLINSVDVELTRRIGAGSFGEVFEGTFKGRAVAVKTLLEVTEENVKNFRGEILLNAALVHPNIVKFIGACWGRDFTALVLEFVSKGSLADMLDGASSDLAQLEWSDPLLKLALDIAVGMAYLHGSKQNDSKEIGEEQKCILHRDLKVLK